MVFSTLPVPALVGEGAAAAYEERLGQTSKEAATPSASVSHCAALAASGGCSWLHNVDECRKIVKHLSNQARPLSQDEVQQLVSLPPPPSGRFHSQSPLLAFPRADAAAEPVTDPAAPPPPTHMIASCRATSCGHTMRFAWSLRFRSGRRRR